MPKTWPNWMPRSTPNRPPKKKHQVEQGAFLFAVERALGETKIQKVKKSPKESPNNWAKFHCRSRTASLSSCGTALRSHHHNRVARAIKKGPKESRKGPKVSQKMGKVDPKIWGSFPSWLLDGTGGGSCRPLSNGRRPSLPRTTMKMRIIIIMRVIMIMIIRIIIIMVSNMMRMRMIMIMKIIIMRWIMIWRLSR